MGLLVSKSKDTKPGPPPGCAWTGSAPSQPLPAAPSCRTSAAGPAHGVEGSRAREGELPLGYRLLCCWAAGLEQQHAFAKGDDVLSKSERECSNSEPIYAEQLSADTSATPRRQLWHAPALSGSHAPLGPRHTSAGTAATSGAPHGPLPAAPAPAPEAPAAGIK